MALPKLTTPEYEMELPSTGETIKYRPFLVKEQKLLLMAQESNNNKQIANAMGKLVSDCTFEKVDAKRNPMFDIEYVFLKVRAKSVGETVELTLTCPDDDETKVKHTVNIEELEIQIQDGHKTDIQLTDDIKINFRYPLMSDMTTMPDKMTQTQTIFHFLTNCIESIDEGDTVHNKVDITKKELDDFIDSFTGEQFENVTNFFESMPKIRHTVEITNPTTKVKSDIVLEGLESFLG
jgi:hypothetical protein